MDDAFPTRLDPSIDLDTAVGRAAEALRARQRSDGHWVFELEADATIPAEYILLRAYLGEPDAPELERKIGAYLRRIQGEDGGWPLFHAGAMDVSATLKAYFALKMIGDDPAAPHMARAREALLARGGAEKVNVFTRILLALFGIISWRAVPEMPVQIMHLPRWFPIHLAKVSYWARTVIVPLLVLRDLQPRARNPRGVGIDELFVSPPARMRGLQRGAHQKEPWTSGFLALDAVLRVVRPWLPGRAGADRQGQGVRGRPDLQWRGWPGGDLPGHGQLGDDVRRPGLRRGRSEPDHGAGLDREAARRARRRGLLPAVPVAGMGHRPGRARAHGSGR